MAVIQRKGPARRKSLGQTKISPSFQTTLSAEAVRALNLRPGMKLSQTVEGNRLILEPLLGVEALAGSLGIGKATISIEEQNKGAKMAIAKASMKSKAQ